MKQFFACIVYHAFTSLFLVDITIKKSALRTRMALSEIWWIRAHSINQFPETMEIDDYYYTLEDDLVCLIHWKQESTQVSIVSIPVGLSRVINR
jgi:hypothetical protein